MKATVDTKACKVKPLDEVVTKAGSRGVVKKVSGEGVANVVWYDGREFSIKVCHLRVVGRSASLPTPKRSLARS